MKIAVTGGAGFIGSHIVEAYIALGHEVVVLDNFSTGKKSNIHPKAKVYDVDIQSEKLTEIFAQEKFNIVNHHAAQIDVRVSVSNPILDAQTNVIGSLNLYQAATSAGVKKIIFASSGGTVYGEQTVFPCDETHSTIPLSPYGVAKLANEMYLNALQFTHGVNYVALRYSNVFGPRQNPHGEAGVFAIFLHKLLQGEQPIINGDGLQTRDYLYIEDAVRANVMALDEQITGAYNISTAIETNVVQIFEALLLATNSTLPKIHADAKSGEPRRGSYSFQLAEKTFGWRPEVTFNNGIQQTVEWFIKQQE